MIEQTSKITAEKEAAQIHLMMKFVINDGTDSSIFLKVSN